jgi:hypothetical protein
MFLYSINKLFFAITQPMVSGGVQKYGFNIFWNTTLHLCFSVGGKFNALIIAWAAIVQD